MEDLIMWLSVIYANCFMLLYRGERRLIKYHGFIIWGFACLYYVFIKTRL